MIAPLDSDGKHAGRGTPLRWLRWLVVPLVVVPLTLLLGFGLTIDPRAIPSALLNKPVPPFSSVAIDGRLVSSASLRGRVIVVNFWASWCAECKVEHPILMDGDRRYGTDVAFIGVLYQDQVVNAIAYLDRYGDSGYPNLLDPDGRLAIDFGVTGVPETFFIDRRGIVRYKHWGAITADVLDRQLRLLPEPATQSPFEAASPTPGAS